MNNILDINIKVVIAYSLVIIAFVLVWKFMGPGSKVDGKKKKK